MDGVPTHVHFVGLRIRRAARSAVRVLAPSRIVGQGSRLAARRTFSFAGTEEPLLGNAPHPPRVLARPS
jgi:hypothetical protein